MPDKCSPMPHALRTQQSPEDAAAEEALAVRRYVRALAQAESVRDELPLLKLRRVVAEGLATFGQKPREAERAR